MDVVGFASATENDLGVQPMADLSSMTKVTDVDGESSREKRVPWGGALRVAVLGRHRYRPRRAVG